MPLPGAGRRDTTGAVEVHSWAEAKSTIEAFPGGSGAVVFAAGFNCTFTTIRDTIAISGNVTITGTSSRVVCDAGRVGQFFAVGADFASFSSTEPPTLPPPETPPPTPFIVGAASLVLRLPITFKNGDGNMGPFYSGGAIVNFGGTIAIEGEATFESNYASRVSVYLPPNACWPTAAC
jgi:hypothetical protein